MNCGIRLSHIGTSRFTLIKRGANISDPECNLGPPSMAVACHGSFQQRHR